MAKNGSRIKPKVKCVECGFFGYREGGIETDGSMYLENKFTECHDNERKKLNSDGSYVHFSEDGRSWDVIGCFHQAWSLLGSNSEDEKGKAKNILNESRACRYYFPYESGYEPAGHNQMRQDEKNRKMMKTVGLINAGAVILAAFLAALLTALATAVLSR